MDKRNQVNEKNRITKINILDEDEFLRRVYQKKLTEYGVECE